VDAASLQVAETYQQRDVPGPLDVLVNIVPENPFRAMAALGAGRTEDGQRVIVPGNFTILQVIFFAGLLGFSLVRVGAKALRLRARLVTARATLRPDTGAVIEALRIGSIGLIAALVGSYGFEQLIPLGKFVIAL